MASRTCVGPALRAVRVGCRRPGGMPYNRRMSPPESSDRGASGDTHAGHTAAEYRDILTSAPRVVVVGCTGSGKTSVARSLARLLDAPRVELDALNWEPDWTAAETDVFRQRVRDALTGEAWVVDGNYSAVRDLVWPRAAMLVWLNLPYRVVSWRLLWRTLKRVFTREELWNGNRGGVQDAVPEHGLAVQMAGWHLPQASRQHTAIPGAAGTRAPGCSDVEVGR